MIKITRLRLKNFKSFKKAEIPFANGFTAIAGANASGKCVSGDTLVLLSDGSSERIDFLVERTMQNAIGKKVLEDGEIAFEGGQKTSVFTLNVNSLKMEAAPVHAFVKRRAPQTLVRIKTRSGREVVTTDYHPLFGTVNGELRVLQAKELSKGAFIATPRQMPVAKKSKLFEELFELIEKKDNLFAPFNEKYLEIIKNFAAERNLSLKETAEELGVNENTLSGLRDRQAINVAHLVKILKKTGYDCESIAEMIPVIKGKSTNITIKALWRNSKEFARLLGYYFAEGSNAGGNIRLVSASPEIINDIKIICKKIFGTEPFVKRYKPNCFDIIIFSKPVGIIFSKFCRHSNARTKKVENIFFRHSDEEIAEFLNGYLSGDGYVSESAVSATTASKDLSDDTAAMLLMLGVQPTIWKKTKSIKKTGFRGAYFEVSVFGQENLKKIAEKIRFIHNGKRQKLENVIKQIKRRHSNTDLIPGLNDTVKNAAIEQEVKYARKKNKNIKLKSYTDRACFPSRHGLQEVLEKEFSAAKNASKNLVSLQKLAFSDIFWDEIVDIAMEKSKEKYVYDLSIAHNHNFVANNIFVHNSNILDGLMFVFGITSLKILRASRLSELINHDAKDDYAKVEIDLKDKETLYTISRIIDSKGQSVLRLNGKKKSLNEISSLLQEIGIKPTGHNIVVQGDVTKVIQMNSKQRREILDEVAGLKEFEEKKEESIRKLEQVDQRIKDATLVLNERQNYLADLEKEKIAAQKFNDFSLELRESRATIIFVELKRNEGELMQANQKIGSIQEEIVKCEKQKAELLSQQEQAEEKIDRFTKQLIEQGEMTYSTIVREIEEKKAQNSSLREKIDEKKSRIASLTEKALSFEREKNPLNQQVDEKKKQASMLREKISVDTFDWEKLKALIDEKSRSVKSKNLDGLEAKIRGLESEAEKVRHALFEKTIAKERLLKEKEVTERLLGFLGDEQKKLEQSLTEKSAVQKQLKEISLLEPDSSVDLKEKEIDEILNSIHSIKSRSEHLSDSVAKLKGLDSACPVCEQKIDPKTVKLLLEQRDRHLKEMAVEMQKRVAEKDVLVSQKQKLIHSLHQLHDLNAKLGGFGGIEQKVADVKLRANNARQKLRELGVEAVFAEEKKLSNALDLLGRQKGPLQQQLSDIKTSALSLQLNQLLEKFHQVGAQKNERQNQLAVLDTLLNDSLKHRLEALEKEKAIAQEQLALLDRSLKEDEARIVVASKELSEKEAQMQKALNASRVLEEEKNRLTTKLSNIEEKTLALEQRISKKEKEINEEKISKSKNEIRVQDLSEEFREFEGTKTLKTADPVELRKRVVELEKQIKTLGAINMKALEKFDELKKEVDFVKEKAEKLDSERKAVLELIDKIELKKISVFMQSFNLVSKKFSDIYFHFFGGEGRLSLSDPQAPTEGGLLIEAKYSEGKLKNIDAMSGGEKSLTALAFIFAIQSVDPAPFYIFDEADAALDKENSLKLGKMVKEISKNSQFISMTHNDSIVKEADQIIGVALNQQKSSVIGLRLKGKIEA